MSSWRANAKSVQDDIVRSKALASEISKQADAPHVSGKATDDIERKTDFIIRELNYNHQVLEALRGIKEVNQTLDQAEKACIERRILDALHLLESRLRSAYSTYGLNLLTNFRILDATGCHICEQVLQGHKAPGHTRV